MATLARLELSETEKEGLGKDISNILEYVSQVSAVSINADTASTLPANMPHNVLRNDVVREAGDIMAAKESKVKEAFPKREGEYNVVRKIIQKDE